MGKARLTAEEREVLLKAQHILEKKTGALPLDLRFRRKRHESGALLGFKVGAMMAIFKEYVWADTLPDLIDKMYEQDWEG